MKQLCFIMSHLQTHYHFKLDFQKVDQRTGGKCLIYRTKHNQLQSLELPCDIPISFCFFPLVLGW